MKDNEWALATASRFRIDGCIGTPFYTRVAKLSGRSWYFNWDLYHVVDEFEDSTTELTAIRESAAIADMSPLSKSEITGPDASNYVNYLSLRDTSKLQVGQIYFTPWCNEMGKVITDGLVFRVAENTFRLTSDPIYQWLVKTSSGFDVQVRDITHDYGIMTVQGPRSRDLLEKVTREDWSELDFSRIERSYADGRQIEIARTGFTGELGYEIFVSRLDAPVVWDAFYEAGQEVGVKPAGEYAVDIARVEAGLLITGCDYANAGPDPSGSHTTASHDPEFISSPYELNMEFFVDLDKPDFMGKKALEEEHAKEPVRKLVGLDIDWRAVSNLFIEQGIAPTISPRVNWRPVRLYSDNENIGWASSTTWSPTLKKLIAFGHVTRKTAKSYETIQVEWPVAGGQNGRIPARMVELPFYELKRKD